MKKEIHLTDLQSRDTPVGHLSREISRVTKFFMDRGATIEVQLTSKHYRRSPIVQGGMEIACKVTVKIISTRLNLFLLEKYKSLVQELYLELKEEEILGNYLQPIHQVPIELPEIPTTNKKRRKLDNTKTKDIRSFLRDVHARQQQAIKTLTKSKITSYK